MRTIFIAGLVALSGSTVAMAQVAQPPANQETAPQTAPETPVDEAMENQTTPTDPTTPDSMQTEPAPGDTMVDETSPVEPTPDDDTTPPQR